VFDAPAKYTVFIAGKHLQLGLIFAIKSNASEAMKKHHMQA
jgi:hypothetical protein